MKKRMDELIRETFVFDVPKLCSSVPEVHVVLGRNEDYSGSLTFSSEDGSRIRGNVFSDNRRIRIEEGEISGSPCTVSYSINSIGAPYGEKITGNIIARTSIGEMSVPVEALIRDNRDENANDEVKALEHFTRMAQNSPARAAEARWK